MVTTPGLDAAVETMPDSGADMAENHDGTAADGSARTVVEC